MFYLPATNLSMPIVLQESQTAVLPTTPFYYAVPQTTFIPAVTGLMYPKYALLTKPIETDQSQVQQKKEIVQHVFHHCVPSCSGYCDLCCPWTKEPPKREQERISRRDEFEQIQKRKTELETIDEKIDRLRRELQSKSISKENKSTETIDYYRPPPSPPLTKTLETPITYKQHYDAPKPRSRSRSRSRSASSRRCSSLPREPWRSTNQNEYPWRDAHLPAYREVSLSRSQTPNNESRSWNETAHERSHYNSQQSSCKGEAYIYRPKSETEARKYYVQTTGKNPDAEVYQTYYCTPVTTSCCQKSNVHSFYSDIPTTTTTHSMKKIDTTQYHDLYGCNQPCLHVVPKGGSTLEPPYLKILDAPCTYLH